MRSRRIRSRIDPEQAGDSAAARASAIGLLARRDYGSGELRKRLEQQGFEAQVSSETIAALLETHVLDDARYAENYVSYHAARGQGPVRIGADLRALGVAEGLIEASLATPDWRTLALEARRRKFGAEAPTAWPEKARQARFLQYRGFSSDHIRLAFGGDYEPD
ncbi:MAG TPA: regulatory protein RecX [Steroidobacteraceae bacterium]|jgi:regulatory protein